MNELLKKYDYDPDKVAIDHGLEMIVSNVDNVFSPDILKACLSMVVRYGDALKKDSDSIV